MSRLSCLKQVLGGIEVFPRISDCPYELLLKIHRFRLSPLLWLVQHVCIPVPESKKLLPVTLAASRVEQNARFGKPRRRDFVVRIDHDALAPRHFNHH